MILTKEMKDKLEKIYQSLLKDPLVQRMKDIPMHRGSNCYVHSFKVAKLAMKHAVKHAKLDLESLLYAAILHDYYLYDWRADKTLLKGHGKRHPFLAAEKAEEDFGVSPFVKKIMSSHMWPLNFKTFPDSEEARILSYCDKVVATQEALISKKHKIKHHEQYMDYIDKLFDDE